MKKISIFLFLILANFIITNSIANAETLGERYGGNEKALQADTTFWISSILKIPVVDAFKLAKQWRNDFKRLNNIDGANIKDAIQEWSVRDKIKPWSAKDKIDDFKHKETVKDFFDKRK